MRVFFKYLIWLLSTLTLVIFFLLATQLGHKLMGSILGTYLSAKTHNSIKVESLNLEYYPQLFIDMQINGVSTVHFDGTANNKTVDMNYHLSGKQYRWNNFFIDSPIDVTGHIEGSLSEMKVKGKGSMFDGNSTYSFTKVPKKFKDMDILLENVRSQELMTFLNYRPLLRGRANIKSHFKLFSTYIKEGSSEISMRRGFMPTVAPYVPFELKAKVDFENITYKVNGKIESDIGSLLLSNASYHKSKKEGKGNYDLRLKNLAYFEDFLRHKYVGALNTVGHFDYKESKFSFNGSTDKFDGILNYKYNDGNLDLDLQGLSLVEMLKQYNYPALLSSKVYGNIDYNIKDKIILINTQLKETRFRETRMTNMIYSATGIDVLADVYDQSSFVAGYQNERLTAILKIDNGVNHIYLDDTVLNSRTNSIDSKFSVHMRGEELYGTIYGTLEDPSVSIDMKKLIKYQVEKKFGSWFRNEKTKEIKNKVSEKLNNFFN